MCNLECRICIRNVWDEPIGQMSSETFNRIIEGLGFFTQSFCFFGGFGEPLVYPNIVDMVARVKALGTPVDLITNGTLLTQEMSRRLMKPASTCSGFPWMELHPKVTLTCAWGLPCLMCLSILPIFEEPVGVATLHPTLLITI